jgi:multicomponent Na+:H+ antiporter subunit D
MLHSNWLTAPIIIPLLAASLGLLFSRWSHGVAVPWQFGLGLAGAIANGLVGAAILIATLDGQRLVLQMGLYPAPFGITLYADGLTGFMLASAGLLGVMVFLYAAGTLDDRARLNFFPLMLFQLMGVNGAFLAGDIFNLYVFFEVLLVASFALLALGGRIDQINGGIRYVVLNLLASTVFLTTAGLIYGTLGTLNMAHMAVRMPDAPRSMQLLMAGLLFVAYGSKAGVFPLFFWLPASYHTAHPAVTAFFGGLLTKVGVYVLFRLYPLVFPAILQEWQPLVMTIAGLTMITGVFGAMAANTVRRLLSFLIISSVGYMIMGLGLAASQDAELARWGMAAGILYVIHQMLVKTSLLMAGGAAEIEAGSGSLLRSQLAGLRQFRPALAVVFFLAAMSMAGMPLTSGFIGKLALLQGAIRDRQWVIAAVSVAVSFFILMSMLRIWQKAFWGYPTLLDPSATPIASRTRQWLTVSPIALLTALSLAAGIFSAPIFGWFQTAADQVMDRAAYIAAVAPTDQIEYLGSHDATE